MRPTLLDASWKTCLTRGLLCVAVAGGLVGCSSSEQVREENDPGPPVADRDTVAQDTVARDTVARDTASASEAQEEETGTRLVMIMNPEAVRQRLREFVQGWYGTPYKWGGDSKRGVDCSGFVQAIYQQAFDWLLPRVTERQVRAGTRIEPNQLRAGDLVFFQPENRYNHVGIYLKNNTFVHASSNEGVTKSSLEDRYWNRYFWMSRRLLKPSRIPDTLKTELVAYRRVPDSTASSDRMLSRTGEAFDPPEVDTSQIELARLRDEPGQPGSEQPDSEQSESERSSSTPTLDSLSTATDTTERTGW